MILAWAIFPLAGDDMDKADDGGTISPAISVGESYTIHSTILGEDRPYKVYQPEGCKEGGAGAPCPVLYILDGDAHFHYGSGMLARMSGNSQIPQMIMVAIPNTTDRLRDLTPTHTMVGFDGKESASNATSGGGDVFLDFIEQELIPEIEERYKPMPYRIFSGHSLGGLMALHSFIDRPELFNAYIAVDPSLWWHDQELVKRAESALKARSDIRNKVFISVAEHPPRGEADSTIMETASERFSYALDANPSPNLYSKMKQYPGEDHGSVAMPSLYDGMLFVFDGYKNPPAAITSQGLESISDYYRDYLAPYGIELIPPGSVLIDMARLAQENGDPESGFAYLHYNLDLRPDDPFTNFMLAMAYEEAGQSTKAIKQYQHTLEIAPQFATFVQPKLDALTNSKE